jgi:hypothetical protein
VLAAAARITNGDAAGWVSEWLALADSCAAAGEAALAGGHRVSALSHYRRAARHYSCALYAIAGSSQADRELELWRRHRACWEHVVDLHPVPGERLAIPYEDTTLPAYFFRAPDARPGEVRPLVVMNNGSDGATSDMWLMGGAAAAERGYHWMTSDGPGQQAALFEQGIPFRPDWEAVLIPVVDVLVARPDVDPARIALIGVSQAGFWVPRALAFEHRFAAAVADPGVVDVSTSWTDHLPKRMTSQLLEGKREGFDRNMRIGEMMSTAPRRCSRSAASPTASRAPRRSTSSPPCSRTAWAMRWRHHHAAPHHRPRERAVLARPVAAPVRPPRRTQGAGAVHGPRGADRREPSPRPCDARSSTGWTAPPADRGPIPPGGGMAPRTTGAT